MACQSETSANGRTTNQKTPIENTRVRLARVFFTVFVSCFYAFRNSRNPVFTAVISDTNHSPMTGTIKTTNPVTIIFNASGLEASPKARLAIPVRAKINAKIPRITLDILFRKIPAHWTSVSTATTGKSRIFAIIFSIVIPDTPLI